MKTIGEIKLIFQRSQATLLQDALGAAALGVILIVALLLPTLP
ncbi:MAG: hypothetical protein AB8B71_05655 [Paracoccaceae bacterium]